MSVTEVKKERETHVHVRDGSKGREPTYMSVTEIIKEKETHVHVRGESNGRETHVHVRDGSKEGKGDPRTCP